MNRRDAVKRGAMFTGAVGAAWSAPLVFDSFASPAAAATCVFIPINRTAIGGSSTCIPARRRVSYTVIGGGGAGGSDQGFNGGIATKIYGQIPAHPTGYTLTYVVPQGGRVDAGTSSHGGAGGTGYVDGGKDSYAAGGGGGGGGGGDGGGGASAIVSDH